MFEWKNELSVAYPRSGPLLARPYTLLTVSYKSPHPLFTWNFLKKAKVKCLYVGRPFLQQYIIDFPSPNINLSSQARTLVDKMIVFKKKNAQHD